MRGNPEARSPMRVLIEFTRGERCCHSGERQCAQCWKREMALYLHESEAAFETHWRTRLAPADDEVPESYSLYTLTGFDEDDAGLAQETGER